MLITKFVVALALLSSCTSDTSPAPLAPPPELPYPAVWQGADEQGNPIVIMTQQTWIALQANIQHARIWMRHAHIELTACGAGDACAQLDDEWTAEVPPIAAQP
jgi:hypothetical protein